MIKKKMLYKLFTLYVGIVLLYTILAGSLALYKEIQISSLKNNYMNVLYMNQVRDYADTKIDLATRFMYESSLSPAILDYKYSKESNYMYLTNVYNELNSRIKNFTQLGFSLGILKSDNDTIISPEGTLKYSYYLDQLGIVDESLKDLDTFFSKLDNKDTFIIPDSFTNNNSKQVIIIHRIAGRLNTPTLYYFIVLDTNLLLPTHNVNGIVNTFSLYSDSLIYSFYNTSNIDQTGIFKYIEDNDLSTDIVNLKLGPTTNYVYQSKIIPNLHYVYTVQNVSFFEIFLTILKNTFIPSLFIFLLGLGIAYKATQTSYKPIRQLLKLISNPHTNSNVSLPKDTTSNISELDYIKQSIEQVYSINNNLQSMLDNSLISLQEDFFRKILYDINDKDFINENIAKLELESFENDLNLILLELEGVGNLNKTIPIDQLSNIIRKTIDNLKSLDKGIDFFVLPLDFKRYCIVSHNLEVAQIYTLSSQIIDSISIDLSLDSVACISSSYNLAHLSSALQETLMLSKHKYSSTNTKLITKENIKENTDTIYFYPLEVETCLINYITTNDFSKANELLKDVLHKNIISINLNLEALTNFKYSLLATFKRSLNTQDQTLSYFNKEYGTLVDTFINAQTAEVEETCLKLFEAIFSYCNKNKFSLNNPTASNIFLYIHENFDKDISLTDIANHFNLSESYVSKLFKSSLNINFKTYVNKLKVKRAKELLSQGIYKISEVSTIIGCNNTNTFIRIFKQYEGISPGEYVKNFVNPQ